MLRRMKTLIAKLTEADIAYYKNDAPIMTDRDYDLLYDELAQLESSTGVILAGSPYPEGVGRDPGGADGGTAYQAHALGREGQDG